MRKTKRAVKEAETAQDAHHELVVKRQKQQKDLTCQISLSVGLLNILSTVVTGNVVFPLTLGQISEHD